MADSDVLIEEQTKTDESLDVPWNVVAHNDPINLMDYVAKVFIRVFGFTKQKAERHMMEVHKKAAPSSGLAGASARSFTSSNSTAFSCKPPSKKADENRMVT